MRNIIWYIDLSGTTDVFMKLLNFTVYIVMFIPFLDSIFRLNKVYYYHYYYQFRTFIYKYLEKERERERERGGGVTQCRQISK